MTTLKFFVNINAPKEKVWETLWSDETYPKWTAAFMEGSYAKGDWEEGGKIQFLTPSGEGMFSVIEKKIPYVQMTFKHLGEVKNGIEEPKDWGGALESYYLQENDGVTQVIVQVDAGDDMNGYFNEAFPKALAILKKICE